MKYTMLALLSAALLLAACGDDPANEEDVANGAEEFDTRLIPVDGTDPEGGADVADADPPGEADVGPVAAGEPVVEVREIGDWFRAVVVNEGAIADPVELEAIGRSVCEGLTPCRAAMWFSASEAATELPVTTEQVVSQIYAFGRSTEGNEVSQWNCELFPELAEDHSCLPRLIGG